MNAHHRWRAGWIVAVVLLLVGLLVLDRTAGGPATSLSRCNLALTRSSAPAADILVMGSSRTGVAIDPVSMQAMLASAGSDATVDRVALGRNPLRANVSLLDNYLTNRGAPDIIAFEISFLTQRSVDRIESLGLGGSADDFLYNRDINLLSYRQLLESSSVARPFTESESGFDQLRFALEGVVRRSGALVYEFASQSPEGFTLGECERDDWTREETWPNDFAFSWGNVPRPRSPSHHVDAARVRIENDGPNRTLADWQLDVESTIYPYDVDEDYRAGEVRLLEEAVTLAADHDVPLVLLPMTLYGAAVDPDDVRLLNERFAGRAEVFDIYGAAGVDLSPYWYDDAHLEIDVAGELTTALLAQYVLDTEVLPSGATP